MVIFPLGGLRCLSNTLENEEMHKDESSPDSDFFTGLYP